MWLFRKSDEQKEKERVLENLKTVDLKKLEKVTLPEEYEFFLQEGGGSGVGKALNFLWDGVRENQESMKKQLGVPLLSGTMVDGMLKHQAYVRKVFEQESCQEVSDDHKPEKGRINSFIGLELVKVLEGIKPEEKKAIVQKTGQLCSGKLFKTVEEKKDVLAKRFTRNTKIPGLEWAVKTVLGQVAKNNESWGNFFASIMPVVFAKQLLSEEDFKKLQP